MQKKEHPRAFISYSWASAEFALSLAERLRNDGIDAIIDKWDLSASIKNEEISTSCVDANVVLNKAENELLKSFYGKTADYYLPVCVEKNNSESFDDPFIDSGKKHIIFVGGLIENILRKQKKAT